MLALLGGFAFALNNVMLKREAAQPEEGRALAMFLGGAVVAGVTATLLSIGGAAGVGWPVGIDARGCCPALGLAIAFMASNLCLQYGAARLSAAVTAVVMPCEVLFAALTVGVVGRRDAARDGAGRRRADPGRDAGQRAREALTRASRSRA